MSYLVVNFNSQLCETLKSQLSQKLSDLISRAQLYSGVPYVCNTQESSIQSHQLYFKGNLGKSTGSIQKVDSEDIQKDLLKT